MAEYAGPNLTQLPGWRIGILFAFFLIFALCWHATLRALDQQFKRRGKRGLRNVLKALKEELLTLGVLSLLLVAVEKYLLLICIPCQAEGDPHCYWGCDAGPEYNAVECAESEHICGVGSEPFWSPASMIQAHILLFVIAVVHILYTALVMVLCLWKVRRWKVYEGESQWEMQPIQYSTVPVPGGNPVMHFLRCFKSMFTESVNGDVYSGLRRLFVERMDLEPDFDFHGFLVESMEEEMARIISVEYMMWIIVILWFTLPPSTWVMVWMGGLSALAMLVVGVKLESINNQLAVDAYQKYGDRSVRRPSPKGPIATSLRAIKTSLSRLSPSPSGASLPSTPHSCPRGGSMHGGAQAQPAADQGMGKGGALGSMGGSLPDGIVHSGEGAQSGRQGSVEGRAAAGQVAETVLEMPPWGRDPRGSGTIGIQMNDTADKKGLAVDPQQQQQQQRQAWAEGGRGSPRKGLASWALPGEAISNGSERAAPATAPAAAGPQLPGTPQRSSVFRRCFAWPGTPLPAPPCSVGGCCGWLPWAGGESEGQVLARVSSFSPRTLGNIMMINVRALNHGELDRTCAVRCCLILAVAAARSYRGLDAASLFWFGRPRLMLRIIQLCYFENSLALATMLFSLWQNVEFDWGRGVTDQWAIITASAVLDVGLLVFSSLLVLPVYAMTNAAGSHCPDSIIEHALKHNIKPEIAKALQRMSMDPTTQGNGQQGPPTMPPPGPAAAAGTAGQSLSVGRTSPTGAAGRSQGQWGAGQPEPSFGLAAAQPRQPGGLAPPQQAAGGAEGGPGSGLPQSTSPQAAAPGRRFFGRGTLLGCLPLGAQRASAPGSGDDSGKVNMPKELSPALPRPLAPGPPLLGRRSVRGACPASIGHHSVGSNGGEGGAGWGDRSEGQGGRQHSGDLERLPLGPEAFEPSGEKEESQRSVTRLLGAMYKRQLQQSLQRSSTGAIASPALAWQEERTGSQGWWPEAGHHYSSMPSSREAARQLQQDPTLSVPPSLRTSLGRAQQAQQRPSLQDVQSLFSLWQQPSNGAAAGAISRPGPPIEPLPRESTLSMPFATHSVGQDAKHAQQQQPVGRLPSLADARALFQLQEVESAGSDDALGREATLAAAGAAGGPREALPKEPTLAMQPSMGSMGSSGRMGHTRLPQPHLQPSAAKLSKAGRRFQTGVASGPQSAPSDRSS